MVAQHPVHWRHALFAEVRGVPWVFVVCSACQLLEDSIVLGARRRQFGFARPLGIRLVFVDVGKSPLGFFKPLNRVFFPRSSVCHDPERFINNTLSHQLGKSGLHFRIPRFRGINVAIHGRAIILNLGIEDDLFRVFPVWYGLDVYLGFSELTDKLARLVVDGLGNGIADSAFELASLNDVLPARAELYRLTISGQYAESFSKG